MSQSTLNTLMRAQCTHPQDTQHKRQATWIRHAHIVTVLNKLLHDSIKLQVLR